MLSKKETKKLEHKHQKKQEQVRNERCLLSSKEYILYELNH
jgi:hypothetical protein